MAFIAWHPNFKLDLPENHRFPMMKYELLHEQLLYENVVEESAFFTPEPLNPEKLIGVHQTDYFQRALNLELDKSEIRRIGFPLSKELIERELCIAQGTIDSAMAAFESGIGFNIAGGTHHAGSHWGEGFCVFNDQAVAAHYLWKQKKAKKLLIIDLDVHQGNGTAEIFKNRDEVYTFSMHGAKNFPFRKEKSDWDVGLDDGMDGETYLTILNDSLNKLFKEVQADFVFYQAGADVLETDKLGRLKLTKQDCKERDRLVFEACRKHSIPIQVSMGGGYSESLAHIVDVHGQTFKEGINLLLK